jgi:hypothetical protein
VRIEVTVRAFDNTPREVDVEGALSEHV